MIIIPRATQTWVWALVPPTLATAWLAPTMLPGAIGGALACGGLFVAWRHPIAVWVAWLMVAGLSLEMSLSDMIGPDAFKITIATVKGTEIGLTVLTILRFGPRFDPFNPALGFAAIAAIGLVVGIHPGLSEGDLTRSLLGSVTPFLPLFCRMPPGWSPAILRAVSVIPIVSVVIASVLCLADLHPLFMDSGGARLAALGHPAFLAGVCLPAIYTGLMRWLLTGSVHTALLLGVNLVILFLTGARAPTAYAMLVIAASLMFAPGAAVPLAHRLVLTAAGAAVIPVLLVVGESFTSLRLFAVLAGEAGNLSGRDLLWPIFEAASAQAPWFGWGLGAGNVVIPYQSELAQLLHTWAAHNEYLRLRVEGGRIGLTLLFLLFVAWIVSHTRQLPPRERLVMRLIFLAYAAHAITDNVLISTPACVFFAFTAAVFGETPSPPPGAERVGVKRGSGTKNPTKSPLGVPNADA
jgi:O-antigen ligase